MSRTAVALLLAGMLALFAAVDHAARPTPDHQALERWRPQDGLAGCAPCGAVCEEN